VTPRPPKAERLPAAERRAQLLDAALQSFGAHGFHATSMNHIAAAAGVTKPVLYQHFSSKDELFLEVVMGAGERVRSEMERELALATSPEDQVTRGFRSVVSILATDEATYRVLFGPRTRTDPVTGPLVTAVESTLAESVAAMLTDLSENPGVRLMLGHAIVGMSEGALRHWYLDDFDLEPAELANHLSELAWAGLRGSKPEPTPDD